MLVMKPKGFWINWNKSVPKCTNIPLITMIINATKNVGINAVKEFATPSGTESGNFITIFFLHTIYKCLRTSKKL